MAGSVKALIERFSLSIVGETPKTVIDVLSMFTLQCLEQWGIPLDDYIAQLRRDSEPPPPVVSRTKSN